MHTASGRSEPEEVKKVKLSEKLAFRLSELVQENFCVIALVSRRLVPAMKAAINPLPVGRSLATA